MPNLRGASPVGRGEGLVVHAWRERSAEASRVKSRSVGGDSRRESELAGGQQPTAIGCNLRMGGIAATNGGTGRDEFQVKFRRGNLTLRRRTSRQEVLTRPLKGARPNQKSRQKFSVRGDRTLAGRRCEMGQVSRRGRRECSVTAWLW